MPSIRPQGRRLVVGGGRAPAGRVSLPDDGDIDVPAFPKLKPTDVSLNIRLAAMPHVVGDINRAPFRDAAFHEVYFEKVPYEAFTGANIGAIMEAARVLEPGGRLVIETGSGAPLAEVQAALRQARFKYIRVTDKGFLRVSGRLGER